jgi:hypothetical protein
MASGTVAASSSGESLTVIRLAASQFGILDVPGPPGWLILIGSWSGSGYRVKLLIRRVAINIETVAQTFRNAILALDERKPARA